MRSLALVFGVAAAYWGLAQLLGWLAAPPEFAVPMWPSAGIALGALVAWGLRVGLGAIRADLFREATAASLGTVPEASIAANIAGGDSRTDYYPLERDSCCIGN